MFRMRTIATIAAGYGIGYVAGAKAGRPAYDRLMERMSRVRQELGMPGQDLAAHAKDSASRVAQEASATAQDLTDAAGQRATASLSQVRDRLNENTG